MLQAYLIFDMFALIIDINATMLGLSGAAYKVQNKQILITASRDSSYFSGILERIILPGWRGKTFSP